MTMATYQADGVSPFGTELRASPRFLGEIIAAAQILVVGGAAIALMTAAHADSQADTHKAQPATPAVRSIYEAPIVLTAPPEPAAAPDSKAVLQALLTKAGLRPHFDVHRLSWGQARRINSLMPATDAAPGAAKPFILSVDSKEGRQALHCLTQAAYFEARGNGPDAEAGVVQVVLNRMRHPDFPKSVCGVVYQGAERNTGCQFSFTCDGSLKRGLDPVAWGQAARVAQRALNGYVVPAVGASTYYHADYVFPAWAPGLVKLATIGPHIFYSMPGALGEATALTGRYAGRELEVTHAVLAAADRLSEKGVRAAQASLKLAQADRTSAGRMHMQLAVTRSAPGNDDAKLNAAQTVAPAPVLASAPVVAPASAPVASLATAPSPAA
jgi:spore germination cell wall hydrolase CwlJ-like protein